MLQMHRRGIVHGTATVIRARCSVRRAIATKNGLLNGELNATTMQEGGSTASQRFDSRGSCHELNKRTK